MMNKMLLALAVLLLVGGTASAQYYVPQTVTAYYPAPVLTAPVPYAVPAPVPYAAYYAPVVVARPRVAYMPVGPAVVAPPVAVAPVYAGPPAVIRSKVYYPGYPIRNTVRFLLP
jgi:hypothetical protein